MRSNTNLGGGGFNFDISPRYNKAGQDKAAQHKKILINSKIYEMFHSSHGDFLIDVLGANQII